MDTWVNDKEFIKKHKRFGDIENAVKKAGITRSVYNTAMRCHNYSEMTDNEFKVAKIMLEILIKRDDTREKANAEIKA